LTQATRGRSGLARTATSLSCHLEERAHAARAAAGLKAGLSHAPNMDGKERFVFFSLPHIAISSEGAVGQIQRPGREELSSACGALVGALKQFQSDKSSMDAHGEGSHDVADPEFTILKQRLAERIRSEGQDVDKMDLVDMTNLAQRAITADLETMIAATVDTVKQDYAVVTGVHIHSWGSAACGNATLEWIAPASIYVVTNGKRTSIDISVRRRQVVHW
jgi:Limiting CO2-inducible proteins B/C beta carbonyic anhydrases